MNTKKEDLESILAAHENAYDYMQGIINGLYVAKSAIKKEIEVVEKDMTQLSEAIIRLKKEISA